MIIFLTLCYIALIFILVKIKILPASLPVKVSPVGFMILLFIFLFIPMQWGAPTGTAQVYRNSVQIVSNVAGQVIEVAAEPNVPLKEGDTLFRIDPTQYRARVEQLTAQLNFAKLRLEQFETLQDRNTGTRFQVEEAQANVAALSAQLVDAQWQLDNTTVTAPADGFVTHVALRPGARVAAFPVSPAMAFIETSETVIGVFVQQAYIRHIEVGQEAEVTFKARPGEVFSAKVESLVPATASGQILIQGTASTASQASNIPFAVRLTLDDSSIASSLPTGAFGQATIYTASMQASHVIRKVMLRMDAWLNYVIPF